MLVRNGNGVGTLRVERAAGTGWESWVYKLDRQDSRKTKARHHECAKRRGRGNETYAKTAGECGRVDGEPDSSTQSRQRRHPRPGAMEGRGCGVTGSAPRRWEGRDKQCQELRASRHRPRRLRTETGGEEGEQHRALQVPDRSHRRAREYTRAQAGTGTRAGRRGSIRTQCHVGCMGGQAGERTGMRQSLTEGGRGAGCKGKQRHCMNGGTGRMEGRSWNLQASQTSFGMTEIHVPVENKEVQPNKKAVS